LTPRRTQRYPAHKRPEETIVKMGNLKPRDVLRALRVAGFELDHWEGSHAILLRSDAGGSRRVSVPVHGDRPLRAGTLRAIIRQAGLTRQEFERLLTGGR
jgi:predicted RNA binding protein YcfA (HicA-like mRNA interferase family)